MPEQRLAHQVRRLAQRAADADVDAGLAEMDRQQLRVAVGEVQQAEVAEGRQVVQLARGLRRARAGPQAGAGGGRERQQAEELAALHWAARYLLTGEFGSSR